MQDREKMFLNLIMIIIKVLAISILNNNSKQTGRFEQVNHNDIWISSLAISIIVSRHGRFEHVRHKDNDYLAWNRTPVM